MQAQIRRVHETPRLVIVYRNFGFDKNISHIGLGVSALQNGKALRGAGYIVEVWAAASFQELSSKLQADRQSALYAHHVPVTHIVIAALWIATNDIKRLVMQYTDIEFAIISHSNIGFLQADPNAIKLLREGAQLAQACPNFHIAANSDKLKEWWVPTYSTPMLTLPNMYPFTSVRHKPSWSGGILRIGCFGALRPQKNVVTAAAAALEVGTRLRCQLLEFWTSGRRVEGGANTVAQAIQEMYVGVPRAELKTNDWESWPEFLDTVGAMDLLMQPSYTESFNMVTADGIARGVASVIGEAIDWAPRNWMASTDSAADIANRSIALLHDPGAVEAGVNALIRHNNEALLNWRDFLVLQP
jgi:glycosyltransferase involved in cell wall biosynthesis